MSHLCSAQTFNLISFNELFCKAAYSSEMPVKTELLLFFYFIWRKQTVFPKTSSILIANNPKYNHRLSTVVKVLTGNMPRKPCV